MAGQPHKNIHLEKYFPRWIFLNVFHNCIFHLSSALFPGIQST